MCIDPMARDKARTGRQILQGQFSRDSKVHTTHDGKRRGGNSQAARVHAQCHTRRKEQRAHIRTPGCMNCILRKLGGVRVRLCDAQIAL